MELTRVRYFSQASIILICCCSSIAFAVNPPDWIELSPSGPPPARSYLAMTYDPVSGKIIAFGGFDGTGYLNDTWSFDGTSWAQIVTQPAPPPRAAAQMTYDSVIQKVVLFGGFDGSNYLGDTWLWDGSTLQWTQATPKHQPSAVTGPMLFPDPNGKADLFGGFDGQFYQLTMWQWNGSDWTGLSPPTVPFARASAAVATIHPRDGLLCLAVSLSIPDSKEWFCLEAAAAVSTRTRRGYGTRLTRLGRACLRRNRRPHAKALA